MCGYFSTAMVKSGYRVFPNSINGNPCDDYGKQLNFSQYSRKQLNDFIDLALQAKISLICSEFSHPCFDFLKLRQDVRVVTVIRSPISRLISSWSFDYAMGYKSSCFSLKAYVSQQYGWCSPSFFVDTFSQSDDFDRKSMQYQHDHKPTKIEDDHSFLVQKAMSNLAGLYGYAIQEDSSSMATLCSDLGIKCLAKKDNKTFSGFQFLKDLLMLRIARCYRSARAEIAKHFLRGKDQAILDLIGSDAKKMLLLDMKFYRLAQDFRRRNTY